MCITLQKADGLLARRVVAEGNMDMQIDEAGHRHHAVGVDGHVAVRSIAAGSDREDFAVAHDDGVAGGDRRGDVPSKNFADIENRKLHVGHASIAENSILAIVREAVKLGVPP